MNVDRDRLLERWREVESTEPGGHEWRAKSLGVDANVALMAGLREPDGRIALLIEAPISRTPSPLFKMQADGVTVVDQRETVKGKALRRIAVVLERPELSEVFVTLVLDLVDVARVAVSTEVACRDVTARLSAWQACLHARRSSLSESEQIGLMGELEVLRHASVSIGYGPAIASWQGPLDGLHDFSGASAAIEVKSALGTASLIYISDAAQLDTRGLSHLVLARPRFRSDADGADLAACVQSIREAIRIDSPGDLMAFDDKLLRAGFVATEFRSELKTTLENICWYEVRDGFPRVDPVSLPTAVTAVTYAIDERALRLFEMGECDSSSVLRQLGSGAG